MAARVQASISSGSFTAMRRRFGHFPRCDPCELEALDVSAIPRFVGNPVRAVLVFLPLPSRHSSAPPSMIAMTEVRLGQAQHPSACQRQALLCLAQSGQRPVLLSVGVSVVRPCPTACRLGPCAEAIGLGSERSPPGGWPSANDRLPDPWRLADAAAGDGGVRGRGHRVERVMQRRGGWAAQCRAGAADPAQLVHREAPHPRQDQAAHIAARTSIPAW
jgi:hypothetical protein